MQFVSISSLQRTTKPMVENEVVCVMKNNEPIFYTVSPERMKELLNAEAISKKAINHIVSETAKSIQIEG